MNGFFKLNFGHESVGKIKGLLKVILFDGTPYFQTLLGEVDGGTITVNMQSCKKVNFAVFL